jgi:hypothetical protein
MLKRISVVNRHHGYREDHVTSFYIGRGTPLGNPYSWRDGTASRSSTSASRALTRLPSVFFSSYPNPEPGAVSCLFASRPAVSKASPTSTTSISKPMNNHTIDSLRENLERLRIFVRD